jgi:hypothetical protein
MGMIADDRTRQNVYQQILKTAHRRLEQSIPNSEGAFSQLSLAAVVNLLFLTRGHWNTLGDYGTTQRALRDIVGEDLLWAEPEKPAPAPVELVN